MPAHGHEPRGAGDRPCIPGPVGQVVAEQVAFVGDDEDVVVGGALGERWDLLLHLLIAAVGAPAAGLILEGALLDDLAAKALGGAFDRIGEQLVVLRRSQHEEPAVPLLPDQVLRERVGEHGARGRCMHHVGAAVLLAQAVVGRAVVDDLGLFAGKRVGELQERGRRQIGEHEMGARVDFGDDVLNELVGIGLLDHVERELLVQEAAGRVVVLDPELGSGNSQIGRRKVEQGQRQRLVAQLAREHDRYDHRVLAAGGGLARVLGSAAAGAAGAPGYPARSAPGDPAKSSADRQRAAQRHRALQARALVATVRQLPSALLLPAAAPNWQTRRQLLF